MYRSLFWFTGAILFGFFLAALYNQAIAPKYAIPAQEIYFQQDLDNTLERLQQLESSIYTQLGQPAQLYIFQQPKGGDIHQILDPVAKHFLKTEPRPQLTALVNLEELAQNLEKKQSHRFWIGSIPALTQHINLTLMKDLGPILIFSLGLLIIYSFSSLELFGRYSLTYTGVLMLVILWTAFSSPIVAYSLADGITHILNHDYLYAPHIELFILLAISCSCNWYLFSYMRGSQCPKTRLNLNLIQTFSTLLLLVLLLNSSAYIEQPTTQKFILAAVAVGHLFNLYGLILVSMRNRSMLSIAHYAGMIAPLVILGIAMVNKVFPLVPTYWLSWGIALSLLVSTLINARYQIVQKEKKLNEQLAHELKQKTLHLEEKNTELNQAKTDLEAANRGLKTLSFTDGLTGLYNRLYFDEQLLTEWRHARREQHPLSLALLDIDHFKALNDEYGHLAGDEGLKMVSRMLKRHFQRGNDAACRYGGEEFVILLPNTPPEQAAIQADKLRQELEASPLIYEDKTIPITASFGVAGVLPQSEHEPLQLLYATDQALYWVKNNGRNGVHISEAL